MTKPTDNDGDEGGGVVLPEEFQKQVSQVIDKAHTKHHTDHIRSRLNEKEDTLREAKMKEKNKGKKHPNIPEVYSAEGMSL